MHELVGKDKIRYLVYVNGRWRWRPTKQMRDRGFGLVNLGAGGPEVDSDGHPRASTEDKQRAVNLNAEWDAVRLGLPASQPRPFVKTYPPRSVGDGYLRAMAIRKAARQTAKIVWTPEQEKRDDWPRAWRWIEPVFGDCDPATIEPEHFLKIDHATGEVSGLVAKIEREVSVTERHRVIKVWRALWVKMDSMGYCGGRKDPALSFVDAGARAARTYGHRRAGTPTPSLAHRRRRN